MPTSADPRYENLAHQAMEDGSHYMRTVAAMADRTEITAAADIYASDGRQLATKGTRIDADLGRHLLKHKLLKPAGLSFEAPGNFMPEYLARRTARLIEEDPWLGQLAERSGDPLALRHGPSRLRLTPQLAFMLTVAREQRPQLFQHLLVVALIAHYLAVCRGFSERDTAGLLITALCHDLGELHTDPALLDPQHQINDDERRYIYVHPITGYLIAREMAPGDAAVALGVLQHQERLDGSGYPYGLNAGAIGSFARIIGVADVCASILARFGDSRRLDTLMRLNQQKYDAALLALLQDGFRRQAAPPGISVAPPLTHLVAAARLLEQWETFRAALLRAGDKRPGAEMAFLFERMANLRSVLLQFGFDPDNQRLLMSLAAEDAQVAAELNAALDEVRWQFSDLEREITRRQETLAPLLPDAESALLNGWIAELRTYLGKIDT